MPGFLFLFDRQFYTKRIKDFHHGFQFGITRTH